MDDESKIEAAVENLKKSLAADGVIVDAASRWRRYWLDDQGYKTFCATISYCKKDGGAGESEGSRN